MCSIESKKRAARTVRYLVTSEVWPLVSLGVGWNSQETLSFAVIEILPQSAGSNKCYKTRHVYVLC